MDHSRCSSSLYLYQPNRIMCEIMWCACSQLSASPPNFWTKGTEVIYTSLLITKWPRLDEFRGCGLETERDMKLIFYDNGALQRASLAI